jgi:Transposase DDE domain group 1
MSKESLFTPLQLGACRPGSRRWPALRHSTGLSLVTIKIPVVIKSAPTMRRSRTPFCRWVCAVCPSIARRSSSICMLVTIRCTASRKDVSFHGYYGCYCYLPLFAFVGSIPLWAELRTSEGDAARGAVDALKKIVSAVRKRCPKAQIIVRADSGFVARRSWPVQRSDAERPPVSIKHAKSSPPLVSAIVNRSRLNH